MYKIALCDDVKIQLDLVKDYIQELSLELSQTIDITTYSCGEQLIRSYCQGKRFDIILLDIQMKDMDGMETAERIRALDRHVIIMFLSGYTDYLEKGYEVQAFRYLIKPVNKEKIHKALSAAISQIQVKKRGFYVLSSGSEDIKFLLDDIYYFESKDHMVYIYESDNTTCVRARLKDIEEDLTHKGFVRCHKGYLVNVFRIKKFSNRDLILDNGSTIPVSRSRAKASKEAFMLVMR